MADHKKALLLWTWWGNDIVSTIIIALRLQKLGIQTDIAGVLSPAVIHYFNGKIEQEINKVEWRVTREILSKTPKTISFFDGELPEIIRRHEIQIDNMYDFSLRYGTERLSKKLQELIHTNAYDLFVAVDVWWDILARWAQDTTLLSPVMDFASLHILKDIPIETSLDEFGLGTDGELRPDGMREIIQEQRDKKIVREESDISLNDPEIKIFTSIYEEVAKIRRGHTGTILLETLKHIGEDKDYVTPYRYVSQLGKTKTEHRFDVTIPHESFGKIYTLDGKKFAQERWATARSFANTLEQYSKLKSMQPSRKTELDLFYLWSDKEWTTPIRSGNCLHLLAPSTTMEEEQRTMLIHTGIDMLVKWEVDLSLVLQTDIPLLSKHSHLIAENAGNFAVVYADNTKKISAKNTAEQVISYQK